MHTRQTKKQVIMDSVEEKQINKVYKFVNLLSCKK